jgi:hypothetical protein
MLQAMNERAAPTAAAFAAALKPLMTEADGARNA